MNEETLAGGIANAGSVTRRGGEVLRPSNVHSASIHRFLSALRAAGFDGASEPIGIAADGRERLVFVDGAVPIPPYPDWAQHDSTLASIAELMRRFHDASRSFDPSGSTWSDEMGDPAGSAPGSIVCHNDVCLENVVFRDGAAVALLDFDFAAPGRPVYDIVQMARMCVPINTDANAAREGWQPADRPARLRVVADAYGMDGIARAQMLALMSESIRRGGEFIRKRVEAGDLNFIKVWNEIGGMAPYDRRREWWTASHDDFATALGVG